jgi:inorganic triphosphatase YgiF
MNVVAPLGALEEIELKLALPNSDPAGLIQRLGRTPVLARRRPTRRHLHNVYYDTPEQVLHQQRIALRLRRVGTGAKPQWLQTLKTGGSSDSALSQRGEWETPVTSAALSPSALRETPWASIDPEGVLFAALAPCFVTTFERTTWLVRRRDRSMVEVALDIGHIEANGKTTSICELELELLAGSSDALFELAQQIAASVAVLPLNQSKSQRGYALAQDTLEAPLCARPVGLSTELELPQAASLVLREMLSQFTTNLHALRRSDDPELVHQARVGWWRFRSGLRLFKPVLCASALPSWQELRPLLGLLGELRDLDVARMETLPALSLVYTCADPRRAQAWKLMMQALKDSAQATRHTLRHELEKPAVGASLLGITYWLECPLSKMGTTDTTGSAEASLRAWALRRISTLHRRFRSAQRAMTQPEDEHRARILAKRLRYGIEALRPLLPKRCRQRWYSNAVELQAYIGSERDMIQACTLVAKLDVDHGLQEFFRGLLSGRISNSKD